LTSGNPLLTTTGHVHVKHLELNPLLTSELFKYMAHYQSTGVVELTLIIRQLSPEELLGPLNDVEEQFAPETLYISGDEKLLREHPRVSIIGTRKPSDKGIQTAKEITQFLTQKRVVIVSGLATGIDTVAHTTAINSGGKTIGVLGTPLDKYYPAENKNLQNEIAANHLLISQFPPGTPIQRHNFPMRNRTMALISHASVIIEAGKTSGTQHQGWEALRLGRPLFIMESLVKDTSLQWPQKLVEYGAQPLRMENLDVLLEYLPEQVTQDAFAF